MNGKCEVTVIHNADPHARIFETDLPDRPIEQRGLPGRKQPGCSQPGMGSNPDLPEVFLNFLSPAIPRYRAITGEKSRIDHLSLNPRVKPINARYKPESVCIRHISCVRFNS